MGSGIENIPENDWLPVTLQNLPSPPLIRNLDRAKGPLVRFRSTLERTGYHGKKSRI